MSEPKTATLSAKLIHAQSKQELGSVERTMAFVNEKEEEQTETRTLDDVIGDFVKQIEAVCAEKKVAIQDVEGLYDQIAIGFVVNSKLSKEKTSTTVIEVPVCDVAKQGGVNQP